jgi:hypothetical protein
MATTVEISLPRFRSLQEAQASRPDLGDFDMEEGGLVTAFEPGVGRVAVGVVTDAPGVPLPRPRPVLIGEPQQSPLFNLPGLFGLGAKVPPSWWWWLVVAAIVVGAGAALSSGPRRALRRARA